MKQQKEGGKGTKIQFCCLKIYGCEESSINTWLNWIGLD